MSAGITHKMKIKFTPDKNTDISTKLTVLTEIGHIYIDINC